MNKDYQAYLLRFQRGEGQLHWRVYMENAANGEVQHFVTEQDLLIYLRKALEIKSDELDNNDPCTKNF